MKQKPNKREIINNSLKIFLILLLVSILSFPTVLAQQNQRLTIIRDDWIVEPNEEFTVTVTDEDGSVVSDAKVSIDAGMTGVKTNSNGVAYLTAPSTEGKYSIVARKSGYISFEGEIKVDSGPAFWETTTFPIILGGICLIGAILFVFFREKKSIYNRAAQISKNNILEKYGKTQQKNKTKNQTQKTHTPPENNLTYNQNKKNIYQNPYQPKPVRSRNENDSKVEEIRIRRPRKEKKVVSVDDEDKTEKVIQDAKMKKRDDEWFQGNDEAKYEVGKITGEVDEEKIDKWFEGVDNIKEKIDQKVKKDKKKRKKDEED